MSISQHKASYKVLNNQAYEKSLVKRGRVDLWLDESVYSQWLYQGKRKPGGAVLYSERAIELGLLLRQVYRLSYRETEGLLRSLFSLQNWALPVPDYSTLQRRSGKLKVELCSDVSKEKPLSIVVDSTGLKVAGEGEWKVRKYGYSQRRTWRKLHVLMDLETQTILEVVLSENSVDDAKAVPKLMDKVADYAIYSFHGDGGYDEEQVRLLLDELDIVQVIPPQKNAILRPKKAHLKQRNQAIEKIKQTDRKTWKQQVNYHRRSLVEVAMFRYKTMIGDKLKSRKLDHQQVEVKISCKIINKFTQLGMPVCVQVTPEMQRRKEAKKSRQK